MNNTIIIEIPKEGDKLTFGQIAVGCKFNPSGIFEVDEVKLLMARVIDINNDEYSKRQATNGTVTKQLSWIENVLHTAAFNACIAAQMAVVKFITLFK